MPQLPVNALSTSIARGSDGGGNYYSNLEVHLAHPEVWEEPPILIPDKGSVELTYKDKKTGQKLTYQSARIGELEEKKKAVHLHVPEELHQVNPEMLSQMQEIFPHLGEAISQEHWILVLNPKARMLTEKGHSFDIPDRAISVNPIVLYALRSQRPEVVIATKLILLTHIASQIHHDKKWFDRWNYRKPISRAESEENFNRIFSHESGRNALRQLLADAPAEVQAALGYDSDEIDPHQSHLKDYAPPSGLVCFLIFDQFRLIRRRTYSALVPLHRLDLFHPANRHPARASNHSNFPEDPQFPSEPILFLDRILVN